MKTCAILLALTAVGVCPGATVSWKPGVGGVFDWCDGANWNGGAVPASTDIAVFGARPSGDQTILVTNDQTIAYLSACFGGEGGGVTTLKGCGTGSLTVSDETSTSYRFFLQHGPLVFDGLKVVADVVQSRIGCGGVGYYSSVVFTNGASFESHGDVHVGENEAGAGGRVTLEEGTSFLVHGKDVYLAYARPGVLWVDGGRLCVTNAGTFRSGWRGEGYCRLNSGEIAVRDSTANPPMYLGISATSRVDDSPYQAHVAGGLLTVCGGRAATPNSTDVVFGSYGRQIADFYCEGGHVDFGASCFKLGDVGNAGNVRTTLTVDGGGRFTAYLVGIRGQGATASGRTCVNLNGNGILELMYGFGTYGNTTVTPTINFNGGTLMFRSKYQRKGFWSDLEGVRQVVYPGGATIRLEDYDAEVTANPRPAGGWGVKSIALASGGSEYNAPPIVTISGGSGSNATAIAILRKDRTVERFVVTCPGEGYAADDVLSVTLSEGTYGGSGAQAGTVTLAENTLPAIRKTGPYALLQKTPSAWTGELHINEGNLVFSKNGSTESTAGVFLPDAAQIQAVCTNVAGKTASYGIGTLVADGGAGSLLPVVDESDRTVPAASAAIGDATLDMSDFRRVNGGVVFIPSTNHFHLSLASSQLAASEADGGVVNGLIYTKTAEGYGFPATDLLTRNPDGTLSAPPSDMSAIPASGANWTPAESGTFEGVSRLGSVRLSMSMGMCEVALSNANPVEVASGMILLRRPQGHNAAFRVTGGGALTTSNPGGFVLSGPCYQTYGRTHSQYPESTQQRYIDFATVRNFRVGPFADHVQGNKVSVTVAGRRFDSPESGMLASLEEDVASTFSGGLYLVNGGVVVKDDRNLGAAESGIHVFGNSSLATSRGQALSVAATRTIRIDPAATLLFSPGAAGSEIAAKIAGSGGLLTGDYGWSGLKGFTSSFPGDHSGFSGTYWIHGITRIAYPSAAAAIRFADATNGVGTLELAGTFTRAPGFNPGEVAWQTHETSQNCGIRGGFGAFGGDLTVNLGGDARTLVVGSDYLPEGTVISLNSESSTGVLVFENHIDLNGRNLKIVAGSGGTTVLSGGAVDSAGGGLLEIEGNVTFDDFVWTIDPSRYAGGNVPVTVGYVRGQALGTLRLSPEVRGWAARIVGSRIKIGPVPPNAIIFR